MKMKKWIIVLSVFGVFFRFCNVGVKGIVFYGMLGFFFNDIKI